MNRPGRILLGWLAFAGGGGKRQGNQAEQAGTGVGGDTVRQAGPGHAIGELVARCAATIELFIGHFCKTALPWLSLHHAAIYTGQRFCQIRGVARRQRASRAWQGSLDRTRRTRFCRRDGTVPNGCHSRRRNLHGCGFRCLCRQGNWLRQGIGLRWCQRWHGSRYWRGNIRRRHGRQLRHRYNRRHDGQQFRRWHWQRWRWRQWLWRLRQFGRCLDGFGWRDDLPVASSAGRDRPGPVHTGHASGPGSCFMAQQIA